MRKYLIIIIVVLLAICSPDLALAEDKLNFDFYQSQYQFDDDFKTRLDVRELNGELGLDYDLTMGLGYKFWNQQNKTSSKLQNLRLKLLKDLMASNTEKIAVGLEADYYKQTVGDHEQDLFNLEQQGLNLVAELEKELVTKTDLFTNIRYSIYNNYQLNTNSLDSAITYESSYNYSLKTGLKFKLDSDMKAKIGYHIKQERVSTPKDLVAVGNYDITEILQLNHGLFLGVETVF